ncbi:MAG: hypothetical protein WD048_12260 [Chitinophagales bacterium]
MKNTILKFAMASTLMAGMIFTGCESSETKMKDAQDEVKDAKEELNEAQQEAKAEAQRKQDAKEWKVFKLEAEAKIKQNDALIAQLRDRMKTSGNTMDKLYANKIDALEEQNKNLKSKIFAYEKSQSDWETFKHEFNHDMDQLTQALNDLTVKNTN